jgi:hypothetical protein
MHKLILCFLWLSCVLIFASCDRPTETENMTASFSPPGIKSLAEIDVADVTYGPQSVVIQGIISPSSQGGWPGRNARYAVHFFTLVAWRKPGEKINQRPLTVLRPVPPNRDYFQDFPAYSLHRMRVLLSSDETRAILEKTDSFDGPDDELIAIGEELRKPVVVSTNLFGDLTLNRQIDWFEGKATWNGKEVEITLVTDNPAALDSILKTAEVLWASQAGWKRRVDQFAAQELLPIKNENWLDDDESELSPEEFIRRMDLKSISISPHGDFEFWHNDGDLFWGHSILIRASLNGGLIDADIPG